MKKHIPTICLSVLLLISIIFSITRVNMVNSLSNENEELSTQISKNLAEIDDLKSQTSEMLSEIEQVKKEKDTYNVKCTLLENYYLNTIVKTAMNNAYFVTFGKDFEEYLPYTYEEAMPLYPNDVYEKYYNEDMKFTDVITMQFN